MNSRFNQLQKTSQGISLWNNTCYRWWLLSDTTSLLRMTLRSMAVSLIAYSITQSTILSGLISTITQVIQQIISIIGGTVIDRHNRRTLIIINSILGCFAWIFVAILIYTKQLSYTTLLSIGCFMAVINGLFGKATDALLRSIVPINQYPQARSMNEGRDSAVQLVGSPLSGLLYGIASWFPFLAMSICDALSAASVSRVRMNTNNSPHKNSKPSSTKTFIRDFAEGWHWAFHHHTLLLLTGLACLINFGSNGIIYTTQLYFISNDISSFKIGLINAGMGIAMLCGSFLSSRLVSHIKVSTSIIATLSCFVIFMSPLLFTNVYPIIFVCVSLSFLFMPLFNAMVMGFILARTPEELQGRVTTAVTIPAQALSVFTSAIAGILLPLIGFNKSIFIFLLPVTICLIEAIAIPRIRHIPGINQWNNTEL